MFVKPREGFKVLHPVHKRHISAEGVEVPDNDSYWIRRLRSGDVVLVEKSKPVDAPAPLPELEPELEPEVDEYPADAEE